MPRSITPATSVENLKTEAKRWLKQLRAHDPDARARLERAYPAVAANPSLRDVQHALAIEHGLENWAALKQSLTKPPVDDEDAWRTFSVETYERLAHDWVAAYDEKDPAALERLNAHYHRSFTFEDFVAQIWDRVYAFRQRSSRVPKNYLQLTEAETVVAQDVGFQSWAALVDALATGAPRVPAYAIDAAESQIAPRRQLTSKEWDQLIGVAREHRLKSLATHSLATDSVLERIADLSDIIELSLSGSRQITDEGLRHLRRMPQLEKLHLHGCKISDKGLEVLRYLPNLREFAMTWRDITDAGAANLRFCDQLENVELMGSTTGDGTIEALQGKAKLRRFTTGRLVTDAGLGFLHNFPRLVTRHEDGAELLIDGPFTDAGMACLAGLDGLTALDLFWHVSGITSEGFAHLAALPNLASLAADGKLSDDGAMRHIAALPALRFLRVQETLATDDGFEALGQSKTLESLWGRRCEGLGNRGFIALSTLPMLRGLGVSCKNVDDKALSRLPHFPSLRELTPIDVKDDGFLHVGGCRQLERLTCMYCRETTDVATGHIAGLHIKYYYAGLTQITDRSLEILGRMPSLEQIDMYECNSITDAGLVHLARLPQLREVNLDSLPGVTLEGTRVFPSRVRVRYST
jgi:Leucine Rich repeat